MKVSALYRHPIKSHGREAIDQVCLTAGETMPWDRTWAVTHDSTKFDADNPAWAHCHNFMLGSRTPGLAGIWARLDEDARRITLTHQDLDPLSICPDDRADVARFIAWVAPLCADNRAAPKDIIAVKGRGMTDSAYPSVSILNMASHHEVAKSLGGLITPEHWRGNIWLDDTSAWAEFGWMDRDVRVGNAVLRVKEPIQRCQVVNTNPVTGVRDVRTLDILNQNFGHQDFGVYAEVITSGAVSLGDTAEVI